MEKFLILLILPTLPTYLTFGANNQVVISCRQMGMNVGRRLQGKQKAIFLKGVSGYGIIFPGCGIMFPGCGTIRHTDREPRMDGVLMRIGMVYC